MQATLDNAAELIQQELSPDEQVLWAGQPRQGLVFRLTDLAFVPFSLLWGGFAIVWEVMAIKSVASAGQEGPVLLFPLFGLPFVLVGLYMIAGRFWFDRWIRRNTIYFVTNKRAVVLKSLWHKRVSSMNLAAMEEVSLSERRDGSGTIVFGRSPFSFGPFGGSAWGMQAAGGGGFEMIPDARQVYQIIRQAQEKSPR